ncbi:transposase, partial [Magnetococcus sp. PR-3]|uniref:transposase n=1 Tax=Magnetococcus sp. PR-3 TaxID=3120355 RepID=UPI002FCE4074
EGYRQYHSAPKVCKRCALLFRCTQSANHTKVLTRHVWEESKERINANRYTPWGKQIYKRRKETVERSFADAKQLHGYRYARMRGLSKVREQCLLTAACQNMKKIALIRALIRRFLVNKKPNKPFDRCLNVFRRFFQNSPQLTPLTS